MRVPTKFNSKVYEVIIISALTYGGECWATKTNNTRKIAACSGKKKQDIEAPPIDEVMCSGRGDGLGGDSLGGDGLGGDGLGGDSLGGDGLGGDSLGGDSSGLCKDDRRTTWPAKHELGATRC